MFELSEAPLDTANLLKLFESEIEGAGGIVTFTGLVRPDSRSGSVRSLLLQAYSPMTERGIAANIEEAKRRWPLTGLNIVHRIGEMQPGETIVFVATASTHRRAAFESADFLMDYLKTEAIFWKRETTDTGEVWIEPRVQDYDDASRWNS